MGTMSDAVHDTITEACVQCGHGWSYHAPRCTSCGCMWSPPKPPEPPLKPPTERDLLIARIRAAIYQELDRQHENDEIDAAGYWDSEWGRLDGEPNWDGVSAAVLDALSAAGFVVRKQVEPERREWSVRGVCQEGDDCDHFGDHGEWVCGATADTREEAEAFPVAQARGAYLVSRVAPGEWQQVEP